MPRVRKHLVWTAILWAACASAPPPASVNQIASPELTTEPGLAPIEAFQVLVAGPEDGELVRRALESDQDDLRMAGLFAVTRIDQNEYSLLEPVAALAGDPSAGVRSTVASILPALNTDANRSRIVAVLETLLQDHIDGVRLASLDAAGHLGGDAVLLLDVIRGAADDNNPIVKMMAVRVTCVVADEAERPELALPVAMSAIADDDTVVRIAAVKGLGRLRQGAVHAFELLLVAADDPTPEVRAAAMGALSKVDAPRAWARCLRGIDDPDRRVVAGAGACLRGVRGEAVEELLARFRHGDRSIERAMALLLAGADPTAAPVLSLAARSGDAESRSLLAYSLWHMSRRSGSAGYVSRWEEKGDWNRRAIRSVLAEVAGFSAKPAGLLSVQHVCAERWGGQLVPVKDGEELACYDHRVDFADVAIRTVVSETAGGQPSMEPGGDLVVEYQALFVLKATNELGLQVAVLQLLEDAGCQYLPGRLPEDAACTGPGGEVRVRLMPGSGIMVVKPLFMVP